MTPLTFQGLLDPCSVTEFFAKHFGEKPLYVSGASNKFSELISWKAVNDILAHQSLSPPRLRLSKADGPLVGKRFMEFKYRNNSPYPFTQISQPELTDELRHGATLNINAIDELWEPVTNLARRLDAAFQVRVGFNLYAGWCSSSGFKIHWDEHDAFVLQIDGQKQWTVYTHTVKYPVDHNDPRTTIPPGPESIVWEGMLTAGDLLYIPRGWWHLATPCNVPTLHLTAGVKRPTGIDLLKWVGDSLQALECVRESVPILDDKEHQSRYLSSIQAAVQKTLANPGILRDFLRDQSLKKIEPRIAFGLPWSATPELLPPSHDGRIKVLSFICELDTVTQPNATKAFIGGRHLEIDESLAPILVSLADLDDLSVEEYYDKYAERHTRDKLRELLVVLVRNGVIVIEEPALGP